MHIGQLIQQELQNQERSVSWFAQQLSCSDTCVSEIFDKESLDTALLFTISKVLDVNFFKYYSAELKKMIEGGISSDMV